MDDRSHGRRNRAVWDRIAPAYVEAGRRNWATGEARWGIWGVPESEANLLPQLAGRDVIELGCGTGYVSSWVARRGGHPVAIDISRAQLATARAFQGEFGLDFPLILADGEHVPLADASFDVALSEYGVSIWCDPYRWVPEAARLLRPGGELVFVVNGTFLVLCVPDEEDILAGEQLLRPYFGMHRFEWPEDESVDFHLGYGDWIRLLRANGFEVEDLVELRPQEGAVASHRLASLDWSRRWPCEEAWKARRR
jgi:SAM-dependent methyltransferase